MSTARENLDGAVKKIKKREEDEDERMGRHLGPRGILNTITPCAACKLLRRRCSQECPFSPYFSPHEPHKFSSVHKVFGASNVSKMLMEVPQQQRADAANSLVYEATIRLKDPIYGCMGAISALQQQVQSLEEELRAVRGEILKHRYRQNSESITSPTPRSTGAVSVAVSPPIPTPSPTPHAPSPSSSSMYTPPSCSTDYSSITNENPPFYG